MSQDQDRPKFWKAVIDFFKPTMTKLIILAIFIVPIVIGIYWPTFLGDPGHEHENNGPFQNHAAFMLWPYVHIRSLFWVHPDPEHEPWYTYFYFTYRDLAFVTLIYYVPTLLIAQFVKVWKRVRFV